MEISYSSKVILYPLNIKEDRKNFIVEHALTNEFFEMPKICIDAIELINKGESLDKIENQLKTDYPNEEVDLLEFIDQLIEFRLVKEIDGKTFNVKKVEETPKGFQWISPAVGKLFFNRVTTKIYILLAIINVTLLITNPKLVPNYTDLFIIDSVMINMLIYMSISLTLLFIHEFGHVIAMRSFNLPTKLEIGNRFFFVVLETDLSQIWKLSPKERNVLYFAGLSFEQIILFVALLLKLFLPVSDHLIFGIIAVIVMDLFFKVIYQSMIFMKTDFYYILENMSGSYNLMENGKNYLKRWIPFLKVDKSTVAYAREKIFVQLYCGLYSIGFLLMSVLLLFFIVPQLTTFYNQSTHNITKPITDIAFWDGLIFFVQLILLIGLLSYSLLKKRRETKARDVY